MRDIVAAKQAALAHIQSNGFGTVPIGIIDAKTKEFDAGWVFTYQSVRFLETNDIQDSLLGGAPVFVPRTDSPPTSISYHRPVEESIAAFNACGDANGTLSSEVILTGWRFGVLAFKAISAIRIHSTLGLAEAKRVVDECLVDREATVMAKSVEDARELVRKLDEFGIVAKVTYQGYGREAGAS